MARMLKDNEVRVNKSGISIARNLYEQATCGRGFLNFASIGYIIDTGDISINLTDNRYNTHSVYWGTSRGYLVVDAQLMKHRIGQYVGIVDGNRIICKRV